MKNILIIMGIFILLIISSLSYKYYSESTQKSSVVLPEKGLYFIKWKAYHGYSIEEQPYIQLNFVHFYKEMNKYSLPTYLKYVLISENGEEFPATFTGYNYGPKDNKYSFYTMGLMLSKLHKGSYKINKLKLIDSQQGEYIYNIGDWSIDVRDDITKDEISIGKKSFISSMFDSYRAELTNKTNSAINVESLYFKINSDYNITIKTASDFDLSGTLTKDLSLNPQTKKTFIFDFEKKDSEKSSQLEFVSLKPFLVYNMGNERKVFSLATVIYSPAVDDKKLVELIKSN